MAFAVDPARIERYVRVSLWLGAVFNLGAAYVFSHPTSAVGAYLDLPLHVDPLYAGLCALFVALFGGAYGWLAMQRVLDQPLLWIGVIGKAGFFVLALALWSRRVVTEHTLLAASGDMALAVFWFWWLMRARHVALEEPSARRVSADEESS